MNEWRKWRGCFTMYTDCIVRSYFVCLAVCLVTETDATFGVEITATVPGMWHTSVMSVTVTCSSTLMIEIKAFSNLDTLLPDCKLLHSRGLYTLYLLLNVLLSVIVKGTKMRGVGRGHSKGNCFLYSRAGAKAVRLWTRSRQSDDKFIIQHVGNVNYLVVCKTLKWWLHENCI